MKFSFRKFDLIQEKSAMKLGTDSVLLGCFCKVPETGHFLDIGSGTGILSLMLAQRSQGVITSVEMDPIAFLECRENLERSPWTDRLTCINKRIQDVTPDQQFDLIISNPPYFRGHRNVSIEDQQRSMARHDRDLPFEELCGCVNALMTVNGSFWLILPSTEAIEFTTLAEQHGLFLSERIAIHPLPDRKANRMIMCFVRKKGPCQETAFTIYESERVPTEAYIRLTKDFYLWKSIDEDDRLKL